MTTTRLSPRRPRPLIGLAAAAAVLCAAGLAAPAAASSVPKPALNARVTAVPLAKLGRSWHSGCPVSPRGLRLIRMNHWGFDGRVRTGELIVRKQSVQPLLYVFGRAFAAHFPIRQMRVMAEFGGSDVAAMAADNTSAFNCRAVTGNPSRLSQHSYGDAVDINTLENPYVDTRGRVYPAAGARYLDRRHAAKGMIRPGDAITRAMHAVGWKWGGRWWAPDYQHFSANGR
ncbi:M15 family metallopeptidase [Streptomyces sp. NPDC050738]|uniref:M15 family metallopeptidase n=1 Tax=Streptomyces sp. NPDC050738 TaxID=3154744 RepID=UPI0034203F20